MDAFQGRDAGPPYSPLPAGYSVSNVYFTAHQFVFPTPILRGGRESFHRILHWYSRGSRNPYSSSYFYPLPDCLYPIAEGTLGLMLSLPWHSCTTLAVLRQLLVRTLPRQDWGYPTSPLPLSAIPQESCLVHIRVHTTTQYVDRLAPLHMVLHEWTLSDLIRPLPIQANARCVVVIGAPWFTIVLLVDLDKWRITPTGNLLRDITHGRY